MSKKLGWININFLVHRLPALHYTKHEVNRAWPIMARLLNAAQANFCPPVIFK